MTTPKRLLLAALLSMLAAVGCDPAGPASTESATSKKRVIKGSVRLPDFQNLESLGQGAVFRERPGLDVPVTLRRGSGSDEVLAETRTDADGDWEASVPAKTPLDGSVIAEATVEGATLRRGVVTEFGNAVTIRSEALGRMLAQRGTSPAKLPRASYLNLLSMLATAADLTAPVDWSGDETIDQAVERVMEAGSEDERFAERLEALGDGT
jgi:hypothetical protein